MTAEEAAALDYGAGALFAASLTQPDVSGQLRDAGRVAYRLAVRFYIAEDPSRCVVCDDLGCSHCPHVDLEPTDVQIYGAGVR